MLSILKKCCAKPRCLVRLCAVKTDADLAWQLFKERFADIHKTRSSASTLPTKLVNSLESPPISIFTGAASAKKSATPTMFVRSLQNAKHS
jgi:hypothetical protein